jgi:hypothetical protein
MYIIFFTFLKHPTLRTYDFSRRPKSENLTPSGLSVPSSFYTCPVQGWFRRSVWDPETFAPRHKSRAEARPTGLAVSRERLGDPSAQKRCDPTGRCTYRPSVTL